MSADTFVRSVGVDPAAMKAYTWSTLGASGPVLDYEFRYVQDSVSILTRGFIMMDDITMVRVSVSHRADMPKKRLENAAAFLKTFMVRTEQTMLPIANFVSSVASGAGGRAIKCPARAQEALRAGASEKGITFLGTACYSFQSSAEEIRTNLDSMQNKLAMGARKHGWKVLGAAPHEWCKQLTLYGNDVIEWAVIQPREATELGFDGSSTIVVVDTMR